MQFLDPMQKLNTLAKLTKDLSTWHCRVVHLGHKNLLWMAKYVLGREQVSGPAPNEIWMVNDWSSTTKNFSSILNKIYSFSRSSSF